MKSKYLILFFSFTMTFLSSFMGNAQPIEPKELLKKSDKALADIKTVVYKVDYKTKYLARKDTIYTTAVCSLYIAPKNVYNIVDFKSVESNRNIYGYRKYDSNGVFMLNYLLDSQNEVGKPNIYWDKKEKQGALNSYNFLLLKEYFSRKRPFGQYNSLTGKLMIEEIIVTEEMHKNTPVYIVTINFKDSKDTRDSVEKHYIRKSDFLPIAYYSFLRWESMEQYNYYEVDYIAINPDIPLETFKVDENETINAKERYENFKEKIKN